MFKKKNVVDKHSAISSNVFSVFQDTVDQLVEADINIQKDIQVSDALIEQATEERRALVYIRSKNDKLYSKIQEFLS